MDLGKPLGQEGRQGVGVAVPDKEEFAPIRDILIFDDAQGLVSAQEGGILVLLLQIGAVVQGARLRAAAAPGGDGQAVVRDPELHGVRLQPVDTGGGVQGAVEIIAGQLRREVLPGQRLLPQGFQQGVGAVESPQSGPVVVRAVEDWLTGVIRQGGVEVDYGQARLPRRVQQQRLVPALRSSGELLLPDLRRRGDQAQIHRDVRFPGQAGDIRQALVHQLSIRRVHLGDQGVAAEVNTVEHALADELLRPGFQARPAVPQRKLIGKVRLYRVGVAAVRQSGPGELRLLGQGPVLRLGLGLIRQQDVPHQKPPEEQAEKCRQEAAVCFCHVGSPPLRTGNTGRDCSCRPPDRRCRPPVQGPSAPASGPFGPCPADGSRRSFPA